MTSITIITIVVVALLTAVIFGLSWLGYSSCLKAYKLEVNSGIHDKKIHEEYVSKKKDKKGLVGLISSYLVLTLLAGLFITGITYKINGENFTVNNQTALVIKSGSMSDFYDEKTAESLNNDKSLQFDVGDICIFETNIDKLVEGEVYGYKYKNIIITHRLMSFNEETGVCRFKGDNNSSSDGLVSADKVIYHYTGKKVKILGTFILYAQSYFGIWSIIGIVGVAIGSEIVYHKIEKINKEYALRRYPEITLNKVNKKKRGKKDETKK